MEKQQKQEVGGWQDEDPDGGAEKFWKTGRDREVFREQAEDPERAEQAEYRFSDQGPCVPFKRSDPSECQDMEQSEENLAC